MRAVKHAFVLVAVFVFAGGVSAQAPDPVTVAGWAQTFLSGVTSIDARFQQDSWVAVQRHTTTSHGRMRIARPAHVRLDYEGDAAPYAVANGADYLWIEPGDGTWPGQYTRGTSDVVTTVFGLLVGGAPLDHDFVIGACGVVSASAPSGTSCIELRPRAEHAAFERVRMYVLTAEDVRGRPARVAIEQHDGTWNTFTFRDLQVNPSIDATIFSVEPPAGMRPTPASR